MRSARVAEAIENLSAAIAADPAQARAKSVPATARLTGGLKCEVTGPQGQRALTDMPPAMGGAASSSASASRRWKSRSRPMPITAQVV